MLNKCSQEFNQKTTEEPAVVQETQISESVKKASTTGGDGSSLKAEKSSVCTTL